MLNLIIPAQRGNKLLRRMSTNLEVCQATTGVVPAKTAMGGATQIQCLTLGAGQKPSLYFTISLFSFGHELGFLSV